MKRQNFFFLVALLFMCNTLFAQISGGFPVELKPWNPVLPPEFMVSTDGFVPGVYFMRIYRNGELLDTQKLIVK